MPSNLGKILLLLGALFPIAIIYGAREFLRSHYIVSGLLLVFAGLGIWSVIYYLHKVHKMNPLPEKAETVEAASEQAFAYIATYGLPLIGFAVSGIVEVSTLSLFLLLMAFLYVRDSLIHINIVLIVVYKIYKVTTSNGQSVTLLSRKPVRPGDTIPMIKVSEGLRFAKRKANRRLKRVGNSNEHLNDHPSSQL